MCQRKPQLICPQFPLPRLLQGGIELPYAAIKRNIGGWSFISSDGPGVSSRKSLKSTTTNPMPTSSISGCACGKGGLLIWPSLESERKHQE